MIRSVTALAVGFLTIIVLDGVIHLIISIYLYNDIILTGVAGFPSILTSYAVTVAALFYGLIGGLITCSLTQSQHTKVIIALILTTIVSGIMGFEVTGHREPVWYLIADPLLKVMGIFAAYSIFNRQS